jgi:hypothetical protein
VYLAKNLIRFNLKTSDNVLRWLPRILCIIAILFISLFAWDSFSPYRTFWQNMATLMVNLIPSFVLLAVLIIAWKWEKAGGIILVIISLILFIFVFKLNYERTHSIGTSFIITLILDIPFVLSGILFLRSHFRRKKELSGV